MSDDTTEPSALARQLFATLSSAPEHRPDTDAPAQDESAELSDLARHLFVPTTAENDPTEGDIA